MEDSVSLEYIVERSSGRFKSRSHLINHIDMLFGPQMRSEDYAGMLALIRVESTPEWRTFRKFEDDTERTRARNHVLDHSADCEQWEQIELSFDVDDQGEAIWGRPLPKTVTADCAFSLVCEAIDLWAEMQDVLLEEFLDKSSCFILLPDWDGVVLDRIGVRSFGVSAKPLKKNDRQVMMREHADSSSWRMFAFDICESSRVKEVLGESQKWICPVCDASIDDIGVIHHVDYDHECALPATDLALPEGVHRCDYCASNCEDGFASCLARLRLVHMACNYALEKME